MSASHACWPEPSKGEERLRTINPVVIRDWSCRGNGSGTGRLPGSREWVRPGAVAERISLDGETRLTRNPCEKWTLSPT